MSSCILCGKPVSGGNRHRAGTCPPSAKADGNRRTRKRATMHPLRQAGSEAQPRLRSVPGTGVPKGD